MAEPMHDDPDCNKTSIAEILAMLKEKGVKVEQIPSIKQHYFDSTQTAERVQFDDGADEEDTFQKFAEFLKAHPDLLADIKGNFRHSAFIARQISAPSCLGLKRMHSMPPSKDREEPLLGCKSEENLSPQNSPPQSSRLVHID